MSSLGIVLTGIAITIGILGVLIPVMPGALLSLAAILVWAIVEGGPKAWLAFAAAALLIGCTQVLKYIVPGRRLKAAGVPNRALLVGTVFAIIGFFVVPVIGLFVGFPVGIYLGERQRLGSHAAAWQSTKHALKATGLSMVIELAGASAAAMVWFVAVLI